MWICQNCETENEDSSTICDLCGEAKGYNAEHDAAKSIPAVEPEAVLPIRDYSESIDYAAKEKRGKSNGKGILLAVCLALVVSLGFNLNQVNAQKNTNAQHEEIIASLQSEVSSLQTKNKSLQRSVDLDKPRATDYEALCDALSDGNIGYASSNFCASEGVILVRQNETDRKITLTAHWTNGGTVSVDYSPTFSHSANISFDDNSWTNTTTLTIVPISSGITTATFSNDKNSETFKVIIIVRRPSIMITK